jgi:hypothetical protein
MLEFLLELFGERAGGPMKLRLLFQPTIAAILAIRAGLKDSREGRPAFFWTVLVDPARRLPLLGQALKDVSKVFSIAFLLDVVYQFIVYSRPRILESLLVAALLAFVPYLLLRGPVNRIAARRRPTPQ